MSITSVTIGQDGPNVLITIDGKTVVVPWKYADEISKAIKVKARQAEEDDKALLIANDNAILVRVGFPFPMGLSNRSDIQQESAQIAQYDRNLRRYLPGGVKSKEIFGTPSVRHT